MELAFPINGLLKFAVERKSVKKKVPPRIELNRSLSSILFSILAKKLSTALSFPGIGLWIFCSILRRLGALELQLEPVRYQCDELTIRRLSLGV